MWLKRTPYPRYRLYAEPRNYLLPLQSHKERIAQLESRICRDFGVESALCVPMARTGLYLALAEMIRPGQRVIMSPLTIIDVVNAVILAGGRPAFADIVRDSCAIDPEQAESLIDHRTGAVLITHLHGQTAGANVFLEICRRRGVALIEDTAQAFGAIEQGKRLGTIGDLGIYSFGFYKNVNAWQGGMLVSNDPGLLARIRKRMSDFPALSKRRLLAICARGLLTDLATSPLLFSSVTYPLVRCSILRGSKRVNRRLDAESGATRLRAMPARYLERMNDAQASMVLFQLDRVDTDSKIRRAHAARYHEGLKGLDRLITPCASQGLSNTYTTYPIQLRGRANFLRYAQTRGRDIAAQSLRNCADLPEFAEFHRNCENARAAAGELVLLPTYPKYPAAEIQSNIEIVREFFESGSCQSI